MYVELPFILFFLLFVSCYISRQQLSIYNCFAYPEIAEAELIQIGKAVLWTLMICLRLLCFSVCAIQLLPLHRCMLPGYLTWQYLCTFAWIYNELAGRNEQVLSSVGDNYPSPHIYFYNSIGRWRIVDTLFLPTFSHDLPISVYCNFYTMWIEYTQRITFIFITNITMPSAYTGA
jgi:hypothetical protein